MIPVFLSRPNPFLYEQEYFLNKIANILNLYSIRPETLMAKDYNPYESLSCLNEMIKRCFGTIIVSFGQSYIEKGLSKKGAINDGMFFDSKEEELSRVWITSPFCHIEGAISFCNKLPLLIIEQENVKIEGILKAGDHAIICPKFSLSASKDIDIYFESGEFKHAINDWSNQVESLFDFVQNKVY